MKSLLLVRHGESDTTLEDTPLTEKGKEQATYVAKKLLTRTFDKIYVSTQLRAQQTAEPYLLQVKDVPVIHTDDLHEIYGVIVGGKPKPESRPNREAEDRARAAKITKELFAQEGDILVIAHGNLIRYIMASAIGVDPKPIGQFLMFHCAFTKIIYRKDDYYIKYSNKTILPTELRSIKNLK